MEHKQNVLNSLIVLDKTAHAAYMILLFLKFEDIIFHL